MIKKGKVMTKTEFAMLNGKQEEMELVIPIHGIEIMEDGEIMKAYTRHGAAIYYTFSTMDDEKMCVRPKNNKISFLQDQEPSPETIRKIKQWAKDAQRIDKEFWKKIGDDIRKTDEAWKGECRKMNDIKDKEFGEMCDYIKDLHARKNADYGDSFSTIFKKRGWSYAMGHLEEKMNRIDSIAEHGNKIISEKLEDSLVDLACYALMTAIELRKKEK